MAEPFRRLGRVGHVERVERAPRGSTSTPSEFRRQSPVGIYSLTDAGGIAPDPGSRLPYDHSTSRYGLISHGVGRSTT